MLKFCCLIFTTRLSEIFDTTKHEQVVIAQELIKIFKILSYGIKNSLDQLNFSVDDD